jgi:phage gp46-like protein
MLIRVRDTEACEPQSTFLWDSVWLNALHATGGYADWIMAGAEDPAEQRGGLRARMQLMTAILICLFTDRRLPPGETRPGNNQDPRGWWGDSIRLSDEPDAQLGSLLWTLERSVLNAETVRLAYDYCEEALQVLIDQGAVARFELEVRADQVQGHLLIEVRAFDHANIEQVSTHYDIVWQQLRTPAGMNYIAA